MKRFYREVTTKKQDEGGYAVCLDGRPLKTPGGVPLAAPTQAVAEAVAEEWREQEGTILPDTMPLTQLLNTMLDRVAADREFFVSGTLAYLDTDLLCYRAGKPSALADMQSRIWDSPLSWFCGLTGGEMYTTHELGALSQPKETRENLGGIIRAKDDGCLTVIQMVTSVTGSVVLALALAEGHMNAAEVFDAAHVEENYKSEIYNEDMYGKLPQQEQRENAVRRDIEAAEKFIALLYQGQDS